MKKHLLLFDFDGVIVDSFEIAFATAKIVLPELTREGYRGLFSGNIYSRVEEVGYPQEKPHAEDRYFKHYHPQLMQLTPVPGMPDAIRTLADQFHCVIISSGITSLIQTFLEKHGLSDCFTSVLGADIDTSKVRKIQTALRSFHLPASSSLFITDTVGDIREATQAEVPAIAVSWGYHPLEQIFSEKPRAIVQSPQQLVEEIKRNFGE